MLAFLASVILMQFEELKAVKKISIENNNNKYIRYSFLTFINTSHLVRLLSLPLLLLLKRSIILKDDQVHE